MRYQGSKTRLIKHIKPILDEAREPHQPYVEPFVGGGNFMVAMEGDRVGADLFGPTVQALTLIRDHAKDLPKNNREFTEQDYQAVRRDPSHPMHGFAGFAYSFGGKFYAGWARAVSSKGDPRDFVAEAYRAARKQSPGLQGVTLLNTGYDSLPTCAQCLVYCDPPYAQTNGYVTGGFDHAKFWAWCRDMANQGHTVFVSERTAPGWAEVVWEGSLRRNLIKAQDYRPRDPERLYRVN